MSQTMFKWQEEWELIVQEVTPQAHMRSPASLNEGTFLSARVKSYLVAPPRMSLRAA
jgi:hypothetical protein